ncbi:acyl-CoA thioesterase [Paenibacillus luteus]|uniref:acyl-CoA thioesterase n=1 Tax=Paenibacillus luteus TaxID=2545753 RepID=UPI001F4F3D00|nr:acyl-CoA thioesterase [Paenibacillus luteus]
MMEKLNIPLDSRPASASLTIKESIVLPPDTNHHGTIFGGKLMAYIDDVATIAATKHARRPVVTASTDSVDFLHPVRKGDAVSLSAFVTWSHKTSMEVFVRVVTEDLLTGGRKVCATSFLTFVALGEDDKPAVVPSVIAESAEERLLFQTAPERKEARRIRRQESKHFANFMGTDDAFKEPRVQAVPQHSINKGYESAWCAEW